ncbi:MAG: hypothetical protein IPO81_09555 [Kouleothrix sp.]|nr:hypothetical protein [Kouleothrix sp.]
MDRPLAQLCRELSAEIDHLCDGLAAGLLDPSAWQADMARALIEHHIAAFLISHPDRTLTPDDWKTIKFAVGEQIDRLNRFADTIEAEGWSERMRARAQLYPGSLKQTYSAGRWVEWDLPCHPGDGGTECNVGCKCSWRVDVIDVEQGLADAYWVRHIEDSCQGCLSRESLYSPYRIQP